MKKHKSKILAGIVIALVLVFVYWWGGNSPGLRGGKPEETENTEISETITETPEPAAPTETAASAPEVTPEATQAADDIPVNKTEVPAAAESKPRGAENVPVPQSTASAYSPEYSEKGTAEESSVTENKTEPAPIEPQEAVISDKELTCTMSVRCDTALKNISWLTPEKAEIIPEDGVIFSEQTVTFYEGESVFNLLVRELKRNKIHLEFVNTPVYNSAYIEGIANLYEFDCGELSGWMYKVNGIFPNYGCSRYQLKDGDRVEWVYTCDLGPDVGSKGDASMNRGLK